MPPVVALIVRAVIQLGTTLGLWWLAEKTVLPILEEAIVQIARLGGNTPEESRQLLRNEILDAAESFGVGVVVLRTKMPTKMAEKLGFTAKGWGKKPVKTKAKEVLGPPAPKPAPSSGAGGILGKGILTVTGGLIAWNLLTDWVWIGNSLGFLPEALQDDIQKRALAIKQLIDAPKSIIYAAEKDRRSISQQERELIKQAADEAEQSIKNLQRVYTEKFVLYARQDVLAQMRASVKILLLELETLRQMAGLIPRKPVQTVTTEATVIEVYDGDTIKLDNGETVRLVGIDAPESPTPEGERSKKYLKERLTGKRVKVESDPNALIDIYGRRLGVVYLIE